MWKGLVGTVETWVGPALSSVRRFPLGSSVAGLGQRAQILRTLGEKNVCSRKRGCWREEAH